MSIVMILLTLVRLSEPPIDDGLNIAVADYLCLECQIGDSRHFLYFDTCRGVFGPLGKILEDVMPDLFFGQHASLLIV